MTHRVLESEADASGKPGKSVAAAAELAVLGPQALEDGVWSLALACGHSTGEAETARRLYLQATRRGGEAALVFRRWWQERTLAPLPPTSVLQPWATHVHQRIAAVLRERGLLGKEALRLLCYDCGRLFPSRPPRFARSCGACKPYPPSERPHPRGSRVMGSDGFYRAGPFGPTRGQSVLCAHPDCIRLFLSNHSKREYCDEHATDREAARRARARRKGAKHERFRFFVESGAQPVRACFMVGERERVCEIGPAGYQSRDEPEFVQLIQMAAAGLFQVASMTETLATGAARV